MTSTQRPPQEEHKKVFERDPALSGKRTVRRFLFWSALGLLALSFLLSLGLIWVALLFLFGTGIIGFIVKFKRDNQRLIKGTSNHKLLISSLHGMVGFLTAMPVFTLVFVVLFVFSFIADIAVGKAADWVNVTEVVVVKVIENQPRGRYSPWRLLGSSEKVVIRNVEVSQEKSLLIRITVQTAIYFITLALLYPWVVFFFVLAKSFFYFWARAFVSSGGQVTMGLPRYMK